MITIKRIFWPALVAIGAVGTVASWVLDGMDVASFGLPYWAWGVIGLALFFIAVAAILYGFYRTQTKGSEATFNSSQVQTIEFFDGRDSLSKRYPLSNVLKSADTIWALWNTGTQAYVVDAVRSGRIERLILPHVERSSLQFLAYATDKRAEDFKVEIRRLTREAMGANVSVRWFPGLTGNTLMIGNPRSNNAWVHVETVVQFTTASDRPSFRLERSKNEHLFTVLLEAYERIWEASQVPTKEELGD